MQKNTPEIRKNTIGKKLKNWKNTLKIQDNTNKNLKNGPHLILVKNRENAGKNTPEIRKDFKTWNNTRKLGKKYFIKLEKKVLVRHKKGPHFILAE